MTDDSNRALDRDVAHHLRRIAKTKTKPETVRRIGETPAAWAGDVQRAAERVGGALDRDISV